MNFSVTEGRYVITAIFYFPAVKCGGFAFFFFLRRSKHKGWRILAMRFGGDLLCQLRTSAYCKFNRTS